MKRKGLAIFPQAGESSPPLSFIMDISEPFIPAASLAEEWDNPAMTAFKWQEAEDRVAFAQSHTQEEWMAAMENSKLQDVPIRVMPKVRRRFPFKPVQLPW